MSFEFVRRFCCGCCMASNLSCKPASWPEHGLRCEQVRYVARPPLKAMKKAMKKAVTKAVTQAKKQAKKKTAETAMKMATQQAPVTAMKSAMKKAKKSP